MSVRLTASRTLTKWLRLDESSRRAAADWIGRPPVADIVEEARPTFQDIASRLGLSGELASAALHVMGGRAIYPDGSESANPFADWSPERLEQGGLVAAAMRRIVAIVTDDLRRLDVLVDAVGTDETVPDGHRFTANHVYLAWLLWSDLPLAGRTGAEIAADLPGVLPTGHWLTNAPALLLDDYASEQDTRDVYALWTAWRGQRGERRLHKAYAGGQPVEERRRAKRREALRAVLAKYPDVTAGKIHATWDSDGATSGRMLRLSLGCRVHERPPAESTLRADLREMRGRS